MLNSYCSNKLNRNQSSNHKTSCFEQPSVFYEISLTPISGCCWIIYKIHLKRTSYKGRECLNFGSKLQIKHLNIHITYRHIDHMFSCNFCCNQKHCKMQVCRWKIHHGILKNKFVFSKTITNIAFRYFLDAIAYFSYINNYVYLLYC